MAVLLDAEGAGAANVKPPVVALLLDIDDDGAAAVPAAAEFPKENPVEDILPAGAPPPKENPLLPIEPPNAADGFAAFAVEVEARADDLSFVPVLEGRSESQDTHFVADFSLKTLQTSHLALSLVKCENIFPQPNFTSQDRPVPHFFFPPFPLSTKTWQWDSSSSLSLPHVSHFQVSPLDRFASCPVSSSSSSRTVRSCFGPRNNGFCSN